MIPSDFKSWFAGFICAIDGVPNASQWDRIKDVVEGLKVNSPDEELFEYTILMAPSGEARRHSQEPAKTLPGTLS